MKGPGPPALKGGMSDFSSGDPVPAGRPRLQLKKRDPAAVAAAARTRADSASGKANPFGAARPREETLKAKGVDAAEMDRKIEAKSNAVTRLTRQQREEADVLSAAVKVAEDELREANENEMPEMALMATLSEKKKALNDLLEKFAAENLARSAASPRNRSDSRTSAGSHASA